MPGVGAAICTFSAYLVLLPVFVSLVDWHYDGFYDLKQAAIFLFSAAFPFLCLVVFSLDSKSDQKGSGRVYCGWQNKGAPRGAPATSET